MSNFDAGSVAALEYLDVDGAVRALPEPHAEASAASCTPLAVGLMEQEVEERVAQARAEANLEAEKSFQEALTEERAQVRRQFEKNLEAFSAERAEYFNSVEKELVQLALAVVRKILQREANLDPTLLSGLVRIALDRMQCEGAVKIRVPSREAELWRGFVESGADVEWMVESDEALMPGDCIVETEIGTASFGFEAQLRSVEESLSQLMAQRPGKL